MSDKQNQPKPRLSITIMDEGIIEINGVKFQSELVARLIETPPWGLFSLTRNGDVLNATQYANAEAAAKYYVENPEPILNEMKP